MAMWQKNGKKIGIKKSNYVVLVSRKLIANFRTKYFQVIDF